MKLKPPPPQKEVRTDGLTSEFYQTLKKDEYQSFSNTSKKYKRRNSSKFIL